MVLALCIFLATYVLLLTFQKYRPIIALSSAVVFVVLLIPFNFIFLGLKPVFFFFIFSFFLLFAIFAARGLADPVSHNETRLTFLTLPASNGEKFLYRALFVTVFYFVISTVLFVMADVAQYVCHLILKWGMPYLQFATSPTLVTSHLPMVFTESFYSMLPLTMGLSLLLIHATAVLAGFLNKWAFAVILLIVLRRSFFALDWMEKATEGEALLVNIALICLIVFCWWLAYRLFCRRQIV